MLFSSDAAGVLPPLGPLQNDPGAPPSSAISAALMTPAPAGAQTSPPQDATTTQARQASGQELAFVDMSVDGAQELVDGLRAEQSAGRPIEIIQIQAGEDGLRVITETLARYQDVQAVHVFSHGDDQGLTIGSARLDASTLPAHMQDIAAWSAAMAADGDLLLYGCNLAGSSTGQTLVNDIALLSGADVAASTNLTGASALGGDWILEYQRGAIDSAAFSAESWEHTLATVSFQDGVNGYTGTTDTYLDLLSPVANNSTSTTLAAGRATTQNGFQTLLKFENIFGNGAGQIPQGAIITSVTLEIYMTASPTFTNPTFSVYRMLASWSDTASWSSMGDGVNGGEALGTPDMTIKDNGTGPYTFTFSTAGSAMLETLQAWSDNPSSNQGWYIFGDDNSSKASFASSENGTVAYRPKLTVEYTVPSSPTLDLNTGTAGNNHSGSFTEGTPQNITSGTATITPGSGTNMSGMTVTLNNRPNGTSEVLSANTSGTPITANYDSSTGVLTLSGTATAAQYQQVLRSVTYNNLSDNPDTTARTLTVTVTNSYGKTASATSTMSVTAVNDAPTVSTTGSSLGYTENAGAVAVDSGVTVNDVDSTNLSGATVRITGNYVNGQDVLSFLTQNGITGVWDASTGTLTLTGTATVAQYQAALRSITYTNGSDTPSTASRTVSFTVTDGALNSTAATRTIAITAVNDAPVVTTVGGSSTYTENGSAVVVDSGLTVSDVDSTNLSGATVRITGNYVNGQDVLAFTNQNGISGSWDASTGTLTLTGSATVAQYQAALRSITYANSSENPSTTSRTVSFTVTDSSSAASNTATRSVGVTAVNDAPVITSNGGGSSASISISENGTAVTTVTATDVDSSNLVYSISGGADAARFTIDSTTGVLRFVTAPDFEAPTDAGGNNVYDVIVQVSDGTLTDTQALAVTVTDVNEHSVGAVSDVNAGANTVAENATNGSTVGITAQATDADGSNNTVTYTLSDNAGGRFTINASTGVVTVADGTRLNYEAAASHTITVVATSSDGSASSQNFTINLSDVNEFAVGAVSDVNAAGNTVAENAANGTAVGITARAVDADGSNNTVTYTLSDNAGGRFAINASTGVVTVANGSLLDFETATSHSITVLATSSDGSTSSQSFTVNVTDVNEFPVGAVSDINATANTVAENAANGTAVGITAHAVDADGTNNTITYALSDNAGGRFTINASTGVVTVANGTLLDFETASSHTITVVATSSDGSTSSQSFTINVTDRNDAPTAQLPAGLHAVEQVPLALQGLGLSVADIDAGTGQVRVTLSVVSGTLSAAAGSTGVVISGSGTTTLTLTGTITQINALFDGLQGATLGYLIDNDLPPPSDTLTLLVDDQGHSGPGGALTATASTLIAITDVYDAPTVIDHGWSMPFGTPLRMESAQLLQHAQAPELRPLTPQLVQGPSQGTLSLQADGSWLYTPRAGFSGSDTFTYLADDGMGQSNIATVRLTVQAPVGGGVGGPGLPVPPTGPGTSPTTPTQPIVTPPSTDNPGQGGGGTGGEGGHNSGGGTTTPSTPGGDGQNDAPPPGAEASADPTQPAPGQGGRPGMGIGPAPSDHTPYGPARAFSMMLTGPGSAAQNWLDAAFQSVHSMVPGLNTNGGPLGGNLLLAPVNIALGGDTPVHIASALGRLATAATADIPALMELAPTTLQTAGTVLSVGAVWWAARGATLLTSLLVTTPVWRNMDPLPVLSTGADPEGREGDNDDATDAAENAEAELIFDEPRKAELTYADIA